MPKVLEQLKAFYDGLESQQARNMVLAVIGTMAAVGTISWWTSYVPYRALLTDASYEDLMAAAAALDEAGIPYEVEESGDLLVPRDRVGDAHAAAARVHVYPGLDDLNDIPVLVTPTEFAYGVQRALEGDLQRAIDSLSDVSSSSVRIVPPEATSYLMGGSEASASVFLRTRGGRTLSSDQVEGIVAMVAGAVKGLSPDRVSVVDNQGRVLARGDGKPSIGADLAQKRASAEAELVRKVTDLFQKVWADTDRFAVAASVELDETSTQVTTERFDKDAQVQVESQTRSTSSTNSRDQGAAGTDANMPERAAGSASNSAADAAESSQEHVTYATPTEREVTQKPAGGMVRQSVTLVVDRGLLEASKAAAGGQDEDAIVDGIRKAVETAIGADPSRGDAVHVRVDDFAAVPELEPESVPITAYVEPYVPYVLTLAMMGMAFSLLRPLVSSVLTAPIRVPVASRGEEEPEISLAARMELMVKDLERVDPARLENLIESEPRAAARVVSEWTAAG